MLMDAHVENGSAAGILKEAVEIVIASKRETDLIGWYRQGAILGVIFTEVNAGADRPVTEILRKKYETTLAERMGKSRAAKIAVSFHVFPEIWDKNQSGWQADIKLYPEISTTASRHQVPLIIIRMMDVLRRPAIFLV